MTTTRCVRPNRTTGLGHRLAAALILSALLAAFPQPAQAAPVPGDGVPLAGLLAWFDGLLAELGFSWEARGGLEGPGEIDAAFLPDGGVADPVGGSNTSDLKAIQQPQSTERSLSDRAATK